MKVKHRKHYKNINNRKKGNNSKNKNIGNRI